MECQSCGKRVQDEASLFCAYCGVRLERDAALDGLQQALDDLEKLAAGKPPSGETTGEAVRDATPNVDRETTRQPIDFELRQIQCPQCQTASVFEATLGLIHCPACRTSLPIANAQPVRFSQLPPGNAITFVVSYQQMESVVLNWLIEGDYTPKDILTNFTNWMAFPVYLPHYFFKGTFKGHWTASSGYYRKEKYVGNRLATRKNAKGETEFYNELESRTRTVIDWDPVSGQVQGEFMAVGSAIKHDLSDEDLEFIEKANIEGRERFGLPQLKEHILEPLVITKEVAYGKRGKAKVNKIIEKQVVQLIPGETHKDVKWQTTLDYSAEKMYLPYWIAYYEYSGKQYRILVDGQTPARLRGEKPDDKKFRRRISLTRLPFIIIGTIYLIAIMLPPLVTRGFKFDTAYWILVIVGAAVVLAAYLYGLWQKSKLLKDSKAQRIKDLSERKQGATLSL